MGGRRAAPARVLRRGGATSDRLDAIVIGFTQELFDPGDAGEDTTEEVLAQMAEVVPHLMAMLAEAAHTDGPGQALGWCDDQTEFEFGLDVVLDGLEKRRPRKR